MDIFVLSSKGYKNADGNHGDCIVTINGSEAVVYDCGSEEHATRVIEILDENNIEKADLILSHNDDDHFKGIPYLISKGRVNKLFTVLLLKYKKELLDAIDDDRRNSDSIAEAITQKYDNIASLEKTVDLRDVYESASELPSFVKFIGPSFNYMIKAAAKGLDNRESDVIDLETVTNAASIQIQVDIGSKTLLLTGDCTPDAIPKEISLRTYTYIQLPHHGKPELADKIFSAVYPFNHVVYIVSDNTGKTNGGSDDLDEKSHIIKNTKRGDIHLSEQSVGSSRSGSLGI